ncbi:MAG: hypothetical protein ACRD1D_08490 [Acidimicrobiales bacterium]
MDSHVDLYWIPLGAGARVVRASGKVFERLAALGQRRTPCDLYHSALEVVVPEGRFVVEMTPAVDPAGDGRGMVAEGTVGMRGLGRARLFRYEIRRWRGGVIPDVSAAVGGPRRLAIDVAVASHVLDLVPSVPTPVWGRDELDAGEMWTSNSVTTWLLASAGIDTGSLRPPGGGRAPGWDAGLVTAARSPVESRAA